MKRGALLLALFVVFLASSCHDAQKKSSKGSEETLYSGNIMIAVDESF